MVHHLDFMYLEHFQSELYDGILFKIFYKYLIEQMTHISSNLNICGEQLEDFRLNTSESFLQSNNKNDKKNFFDAFDDAKNQFIRLVSLFQVIHKEDVLNASTIIKNNREKIDFSNLLEQRLLILKNKISYIHEEENNIFHFSYDRPMHLLGSLWRTNCGLDLLLLFAYQSILVGNANCICVHLYKKRNIIYLNIKDNGAGLLSQNYKEITLNAQMELSLDRLKHNIDAMHGWDQRQIYWLHHVLMFLQEFYPTFLLKNIPGNNLVSLRLSSDKFLQ